MYFKILIATGWFQLTLAGGMEWFGYNKYQTREECLQGRLLHLRQTKPDYACVVWPHSVGHWVNHNWIRKDFFCSEWRFNQYCAHKDDRNLEAKLLGDGGYSNWAFTPEYLDRQGNTVSRNL